MYKKLLIITGILLVASLHTKSLAQTGIIKGNVTDSIKKSPLPYTTLSLIDKATNQAVRTTLTKDNGNFEFKSLPIKTYLLQVATVGYQNKNIVLPSFDTSGTVINVGEIQLATASTNLNEVVVSTTVVKPIIKQEVDRISYDVQADPENNATNVLDMLRKVPMVSVDASENIKLKGSGNYKILINGKPSALVARNPSDVFKSMPASNILKIEVITTPPAKYDAEGLAGIINIITKKNVDQGYNGSISTKYNTLYGYGINVNGTWKQGKFGLNGYLGYNARDKTLQTTNGYTNNIISPVVSYLSQNGVNNYRGDNTYGSLETSYEFDSLNLLTVSGELYLNDNKNYYSSTSTLENANHSIQQSYSLGNNGKSSYNGGDGSVDYQLGFKKNKDQLLTASYKYSSQVSDQHANILYAKMYHYNVPNYNQYNNSGTTEHTAQLDYVHPLKKITVEAGVKAILRNNFSDFRNDDYDSASKQYIIVPSQTNNFGYQQNVYSIYNSYELKLDKFVVKAGLRVEQTTVDADFASVGNTAKQNYYNWVPSVSMQRKFNGSNSITLGYTKRIQRPGIWQLNPFVDRSNPLVLNEGNPDLQPVINHSIEMNYTNSKKGSITVGLAYSFANNTVENVTSVTKDTITISTYKNVGENRGLGLTLNANYPITKDLNISINSQLLHVWLKGTYNGELYNNSGFQGHCFVNTSYNFKHDFHVGFDIGYDSRYVLLQGRDNEYFYASFSASKDLLKKKLNFSIYAGDPFIETRKVDFYTNTSSFNQYNYDVNYGRRINFTLKYKFGQLGSSIKKNERSISNDDVSGRGR